jgi:hypothetical protein
MDALSAVIRNDTIKLNLLAPSALASPALVMTLLITVINTISP